MKKVFLVALVAILGAANAAAQTALSFSGDRATISSGGTYYIPQSVWSNPAFHTPGGSWTLYLDIVNSLEPSVGYQNFVGENSWMPEPGSARTPTERKQQYIQIDIPGNWFNSFGGNRGMLTIRRICDPTLIVGSTSKDLSAWGTSPINVPHGTPVQLILDQRFTDPGTNWIEANGVEIGSHQTSYPLSGSGTVVYTVNSRDGKSYNATYSRQFTLNYEATVTTYTITTTSQPSPGGTTSGGGTFNAGTSRTVTATPNSGYAFVNWKENGSIVSTNANYTFTLNGNRNLVANFQTIPVTGVSLNKTALSLVVGTTETLVATIQPANATNQNVSWASSNTSIASVDATGKVTAVAAGSATITLTTQDGNKTATCAVTVTAATVPVTGVTLNQTALEKVVGDATVTLIATVQPTNATNKNVSWTSSNPSVASVSNGTLTFLSAGATVITVTTQDGNKTATCAVTVENQLPFPIFDGLQGEYTTGAAPVVLKLKGKDAEKFTVFTVNGVTTSTFTPSTPGTYLIEALSGEGNRILTYVNVK